jgi:hypothetical protein
MGIPLYSARGCTQTLVPIKAVQVQRRTINGNLIDLSYPQFQKYSTEITCKDRRGPAIDGIWPGREITIYCIAELAHPIGNAPQRVAVGGSTYTEGGFVRYRPILDVRITDFKTAPEEWMADVAWMLRAEEK